MKHEEAIKPHYPLVVIGAGPAGLAAASLAAQHGVDVALFDEQAAPGGQIYRAIETLTDAKLKLLGPDYGRGVQLAKVFRQSQVSYFPGTRIWSLNAQRELGLLHNDAPHVVTAGQIIIATGAMERPVPLPGWTLPGVMNAGAGQILFKAHGLVPGDSVVLAGSGPLLLLLAWQYLQAGIKPQALLDLTPATNLLRALPHLPRALLANHYLRKGLRYEWDLRRAGVRMLRNVSDLRAAGDDQLESVSYRRRGKTETLHTDHLLLHFGVIPVNHLSQVAGCQHAWHHSQQCWRPSIDAWGQSSVDGILVAGDGAAIAGARSAEHAGRLAALQALHAIGKLDIGKRDQQAAQERKALRRDGAVRPFLEALFRIPDALLQVPDDNTVVCRCEEVSAGTVRTAVAAGHHDNNQVKFFTRCGMGPCQGRQCAGAVSHIVAAATGNPVAASGYYRSRPPVNTLTLAQLAALYPEEVE